MLQIEKNILKWLEDHILIIACVAGLILSVLIRISMSGHVSGDYTTYLEPWFYTIKDAGGIKSLRYQVGDYNMVYQLLIACMTYLPIKNPLYAYKILSCIFDYALVGVVAFGIYDMSEKDKMSRALLAAALVAFSPIVFFNSAAWAQCDAMYTVFAVLAIIYLCKEKYAGAFIFLGIAFAFKIQTVFILPFFLIVYFMKKKFSILYFAIVPVVMEILAIPNIVMGRKWTDVFTVYLNQTNTWQYMYCNYPSFWAIACEGAGGTTNCYETLNKAAIFTTVVVLMIFMVVWIVKKIELNRENLIYMAFILSYTCVMFLPAMHERYGYMYEILAIFVAFMNKKTRLLLIPLWGISVITYGRYLCLHEINMMVFAIINVAVYVSYVVILMNNMLKVKDNKSRAEAMK